jgi:hypothetical protein
MMTVLLALLVLVCVGPLCTALSVAGALLSGLGTF